jgi:hypothetical protein
MYDTAILTPSTTVVNGEKRGLRLSHNGRGWEGYETMIRGPAIGWWGAGSVRGDVLHVHVTCTHTISPLGLVSKQGY